jgi:hypothetical protein
MDCPQGDRVLVQGSSSWSSNTNETHDCSTDRQQNKSCFTEQKSFKFVHCRASKNMRAPVGPAGGEAKVETWLLRQVQWQSRARSKGDVNCILIPYIIEHNGCPPARPACGAAKLEKWLLRQLRDSTENRGSGWRSFEYNRAFSNAPDFLWWLIVFTI